MSYKLSGPEGLDSHSNVEINKFGFIKLNQKTQIVDESKGHLKLFLQMQLL
jgi:hypothetical protein